MAINPHAKPASIFSDGCSTNFLALLATPPHWHEGILEEQYRIAFTAASCAVVNLLVREGISL